ncbi:MAG TPA: helix-turn-helix domain-containing protein [Sphingomicrobium sp.]|nr:helix-turn-helix domain-containing protein [Sphingomicrobium sp.]
MTAPVDGRSERSRAAILGAFVELIFRSGFENVSVQAIVAGAGIARSTFYEHFSNKEDVLRASMAQFFEVLAQCVSRESEPPELAGVLNHFWGNRRLVDAIFAGTPRKILALSLSEMIETCLRNRGDKVLIPSRLAAIHLAEAQLALVESWLRGRAFASAEDMAAALHRSSKASAESLIRPE